MSLKMKNSQKQKVINQVIIEGFENKKEVDNIIDDINNVILNEARGDEGEGGVGGEEGAGPPSLRVASRSLLQEMVERVYELKVNEDIQAYVEESNELNLHLK